MQLKIKGNTGDGERGRKPSYERTKMVEDLHSVEMEISYVCKRRLHIRSILKLSITRRRREP